MFSTSYDYDNIMHYSTVAFAKNKSIPTIIPLHPIAASDAVSSTSENMDQRNGKSLIAQIEHFAETKLFGEKHFLPQFSYFSGLQYSIAMTEGDIMRVNRIYMCEDASN